MSELVLSTATWICWIRKGNIGLMVFSLLPLSNLKSHCRKVVRLSLFCRYYFGRSSSQLAELVPFIFSCRRSTRYSDRLQHDFSITISRFCKDFNVSSFFPRTATRWSFLPAKCFPWNYDLNGFKSRVNKVKNEYTRTTSVISLYCVLI